MGRRVVALSKLDKVLWPGDGVTKRDLIDYYQSVAPRMLPHVRDRLMTLERFPDGITSGRFYSKDVPDYFPEWIDRRTVDKRGGTVTHVVCNRAADLVYLANQACITLHVGLSRIDTLDNPDEMIFDLDPSGDDFDTVRKTALALRSLLADLGLASFVKTSGSKGLHVVVPLDRSSSFDDVRRFAGDVASVMVAGAPDRLTLEQRKAKRAGRLFFDYLRNGYGATAVAPYSVRARPGAPAAVPLEWGEVDDDSLRPDGFGLARAAERAAAVDPWAGWRRRARSLSRARQLLDRLG